jgi:hypothetical protein
LRIDPDPVLPPSDSFYGPDRWVRDKDGHLGFLGAQGHTFVGRFLTWWSHLGAAYSTSLSELVECSSTSAAWLQGFLSGSEPEPWFGDDFDFGEDDPRSAIYREALAAYHLTGVWKERNCEMCGAEMLPSAPVGLVCFDHGGAITSNWPIIRPDAHQGPRS